MIYLYDYLYYSEVAIGWIGMDRAYNEKPGVEQLLKEIKELREREEYYKNIIESANKGIRAINNDYKTVYINYRMAEMLGTTIDEAI